MVKLLGFNSKDECLNEISALKQSVNPAKRAELMARLEKDGSVSGFEIEILRRDGTHAWVKGAATIYPQEDYIEGVFIDITATKVLSKSENETLSFILQGKTNKEIARILSRSVRTIESHRAKIMQKLNVGSLAQLLQRTQFFIPKLGKEEKY